MKTSSCHSSLPRLLAFTPESSPNGTHSSHVEVRRNAHVRSDCRRRARRHSSRGPHSPADPRPEPRRFPSSTLRAHRRSNLPWSCSEPLCSQLQFHPSCPSCSAWTTSRRRFRRLRARAHRRARGSGRRGLRAGNGGAREHATGGARPRQPFQSRPNSSRASTTPSGVAWMRYADARRSGRSVMTSTGSVPS